MKISIIVAIGNQNQMGLNNKLPWSLKDDLKHFTATTSGHCVLMGKNTHFSIGRALPNRTNIVVSHGDIENNGEIIVKHSIEDAVEYAKSQNETELFIIGGMAVYDYFLKNDLTDCIYLTKVNYDGEADVFFSEIDMSKWSIVDSRQYQKDSKNQYDFTVEKLIRTK